MTKADISGSGRIDRLILCAPVKHDDLEIVTIGGLIDIEYMAYMLKYDPIHGRLDGTVDVQDGMLVVNGRKIRVMAEREPRLINWGAAGIEYVVESTGRSLTKELLQGYTGVGVKHVVTFVSSKDGTPIFVTGVNLEKYVRGIQFVSSAPYTANCFAPPVKVLNDNFNVEQGLMTTVHTATATQETMDDLSLEDQRGGRSAIGNIIPFSTDAAKAVGKVVLELDDELTGIFFRVPTMDISVVGLVVQLKRGAGYDKIRVVMRKAPEINLKRIMEYCDKLLVSQDFASDLHTSIFDAKAGITLTDTFAKVVVWYDDEWGYSNKVLCLIAYMAEVNKQSH